MKRRAFFYIYFAVCLICGFLMDSLVSGSSEKYSASEIQQDIDDILNQQAGSCHCGSIQEWIDKSLSGDAGLSPTDWIVIALSQYKGRYDYTAYLKTLTNYAKNMDSKKGTDYQRIALTFSALGENHSFVQDTIDTKAGTLGIMSYIYALDLMDSGAYTSDVVTRDQLIKKILELQLEDGGFALSGNSGDVDITAMAVQSLALYYKDSDVNEAVDKALSLLSKRQAEDGDFKSYGEPTAESTAQVLTALSSLHIKWQTDVRFIKNGNTIYDGLMKYRLKDGSFSHTYQGQSDGLATVQVMYSLIAAWREKNGMTSLYRFTEKQAARVIKDERFAETESPSADESTVQTENTANSDHFVTFLKGLPTTGRRIKCILILSIIIVSAVLWLRMLFKKRFHWKNAAVIFAAAVMLAGYIAGSNVQTKQEYEESAWYTGKQGIEVTISIRCDKAVGKYENAYIPKDGMILNRVKCRVSDEASVYDALCSIAKKKGIQIDFSGTKSSGIYVEGIQYLYEYDCGGLSGWMYQVNGEFPNTRCSSYSLKDGDEIVWVYTLNMGKDVEHS